MNDIVLLWVVKIGIAVLVTLFGGAFLLLNTEPSKNPLTLLKEWHDSASEESDGGNGTQNHS